MHDAGLKLGPSCWPPSEGGPRGVRSRSRSPRKAFVGLAKSFFLAPRATDIKKKKDIGVNPLM